MATPSRMIQREHSLVVKENCCRIRRSRRQSGGMMYIGAPRTLPHFFSRTLLLHPSFTSSFSSLLTLGRFTSTLSLRTGLNSAIFYMNSSIFIINITSPKMKLASQIKSTTLKRKVPARVVRCIVFTSLLLSFLARCCQS